MNPYHIALQVCHYTASLGHLSLVDKSNEDGEGTTVALLLVVCLTQPLQAQTQYLF